MDLQALSLNPDAAVVGAHVYLIGNDGGEKLNILRGTISRLDMSVPNSFDSNIELIQASAAGKGGCSGGPLLTTSGEAIGLCVSRHKSSHLDWFLPLYCPVQVLDCIRQGKPVSRGTVHTVWKREPFYECRQLGLSSEKQAEIHTDKTGLLIARSIIPETEAFNLLEINDILISINGQVVADFTTLENLLNTNIGQYLQVGIIRFGREVVVDLLVHDLSSITPTRILHDLGASFHNVPYRTAVRFKVPLRGMYVSKFDKRFHFGDHSNNYIVESINNIPTPNVIEGTEILRTIAGKYVQNNMHIGADCIQTKSESLFGISMPLTTRDSRPLKSRLIDPGIDHLSPS